METIYKYQLEPIPGQQVIKIPFGFEILSVQNQDEKITIWAKVNKNTPEQYCFAIYGTGHALRNINQQYIGTVKMGNGLVWHVFFVV